MTQHTLDREAIARIISPEIWVQHDRFGKFTTYTQGTAPSLEKADAIIALVSADSATAAGLIERHAQAVVDYEAGRDGSRQRLKEAKAALEVALTAPTPQPPAPPPEALGAGK